MRKETRNRSVEFFELQFQQQVEIEEYALNPFETLALDFLTGSVLDLGSGLGNLSLEAGRRGHKVVAVDASSTAVARINSDAQREALSVNWPWIKCFRSMASGFVPWQGGWFRPYL